MGPRAGIGGIQQRQRLRLAGRRFEPRQRDRHRALAAGPQRLERRRPLLRAQAVPAMAPRDPSAACAAARRAIGTR